jgi:hypothetical protein
MGANTSAGPGAGAGELAIGGIAAFVDALQALRHDSLQLPDLVLFVGFFGIHRSGVMTCAATECGRCLQVDSFAVGNAYSIGMASFHRQGKTC